MSGLLNIGVQALTSNQMALDITGQNISNVNTVGYSRQQVEFSSRAMPQYGVSIDDISRTADMFATRQLWTDTAVSAASTSFVTQANELDNILASSNSSISAAMDEFFSALQTGIDDPLSVTSREVVLAEAGSLAKRFNTLSHFYESQNTTILNKVKTEVSDVTQISRQVADLNKKISYADARGERTSELEDKREELVRQLSELMGVTTQQDGSDINVYVAGGQPLVIGSEYSEVNVVTGVPDPDDIKISVNVSGNEIFIGQDLKTGTVGGLLSYRDEVLVPAWNELGRLAVVFADTMNTQHKQGMDLENTLGIDFFADLNNSGEMIAYTENSTKIAGSPAVTVTDSSKLKATDYVITINDTNEFVITRTSDGARFAEADFTEDGSDPVNQADMTYFEDIENGSLRLSIDGITINIDSENGFIKGDQFLIKPVRDGAQDFALNLTSGRQLALASPVRGTAAVDNNGAAAITSVDITDPEDYTFGAAKGQMSPPVEIVFNAGSPVTYSVLDMSDPENPVPYALNSTTPPSLLTGQEYTSGQPIQLNGFSVTLEGVPKAGDSFSFDYNTDGVSDNTNALKLSDLQQAQLVEGTSYQDVYGLLVERVGTETRVAQLQAEADATVLKNSTSVRDSIAGVNLDEEAANLIKFQQAYQASAQLISASRTLFDTLLSVSGG